jgi:two-component system cell cycle sensor histidine kinase PleC
MKCAKDSGHYPQASDISVTTDISPDLYGVVADERMMKQMVMNLLTNAIKFTPNGGIVTLSATLGSDGDLQIEFRDTGIGIAEDQLEVVLEPFRQVDGSLARRAEGTGLGLALVASMMRLHDGRVELKSRLNEGTTVTLHFNSGRVLPALSAVQVKKGRLSA